LGPRVPAAGLSRGRLAGLALLPRLARELRGVRAPRRQWPGRWARRGAARARPGVAATAIVVARGAREERPRRQVLARIGADGVVKTAVVALIVHRPPVRSKRKLRVRTASDSVSPMTFMLGFRSRGTSLFAELDTAAPTWNAMTTPVVSKSMLFSGPRFLSTTRCPGRYL